MKVCESSVKAAHHFLKLEDFAYYKNVTNKVSCSQ